MTIRSILLSMTVLTLGVGTPLTAQRAVDASGRQPRGSGQGAVDAANRRRAAEQRQHEAERMARLAAANSGPEWKFIRTVGARNGVSVLWDTRTNAILKIRNGTNDQVEATFTVTAYDRAGGAWPRQTFKALLAPKQTKGGFSLSPGRGQRTAGAQVVVMPRILIRNLSREARDRATAEARRRSIDAARRRAETEAQRRTAELERERRLATERERYLQESRERAAQRARREAERTARRARQLEIARRLAQSEAVHQRIELEQERRRAREREQRAARMRAARLAAQRAAERSRVEQARRTRNEQRRSEIMERVRRIHANHDRTQADIKKRLAEIQRLIDKRN